MWRDVLSPPFFLEEKKKIFHEEWLAFKNATVSRLTCLNWKVPATSEKFFPHLETDKKGFFFFLGPKKEKQSNNITCITHEWFLSTFPLLHQKLLQKIRNPALIFFLPVRFLFFLSSPFCQASCWLVFLCFTTKQNNENLSKLFGDSEFETFSFFSVSVFLFPESFSDEKKKSLLLVFLFSTFLHWNTIDRVRCFFLFVRNNAEYLQILRTYVGFRFQ